MSETLDSARKLIADRLREIDAEAASLKQALKHMTGSLDGRRPIRKARGKGEAGRKRPRRSQAPRGQRREQLLEAIKANPGARPSELAKAIGVSQSQVHGLIRKAHAARLIVKKGAGYTLRK